MTACSKETTTCFTKAIKDKEQKEELNQDDKKVVTKVKDMLKEENSRASRYQAKELDKAMKTERY